MTDHAALRALSYETAHVTARAAVASARWVGLGRKEDADQAAVDAMRTALDRLPIAGRVVIGEGERDEAPMLYIGEEVGGGGPEVDIALDPLEGTTLTAKAKPNALCVLALAPRGGLLHAPDVYMNKIAVGPGLPDGIIDLDQSPADNIRAVAEAQGKPVSDCTVCLLDRDRHEEIIADLRAAGARLRLYSDGDVAAVIAVAQSDEFDMYIGRGGAPEVVLAAAALRCVGGQMQGRLHFRNDEERARADRVGVPDPNAKFDLHGLAGGDWVIFAASGVTDGFLVEGAQEVGDACATHTLLMTSMDQGVRELHMELPTAALFEG